METVIYGENLSFSYKEKEILKDINFAIKKGERVGIVGESGSGKSTFLRLLAGLLSPTGGVVSVAGETSAEGIIKKITTHKEILLNYDELLGIEKIGVNQAREQHPRVKLTREGIDPPTQPSRRQITLVDGVFPPERCEIVLARKILLHPSQQRSVVFRSQLPTQIRHASVVSGDSQGASAVSTLFQCDFGACRGVIHLGCVLGIGHALLRGRAVFTGIVQQADALCVCAR